MNLKNLMMWGLIVLLVVGLFQLFQNPKNTIVTDKIPFSDFLKNIDDGRVVQVEIINGIIGVSIIRPENILNVMKEKRGF